MDYIDMDRFARKKAGYTRVPSDVIAQYLGEILFNNVAVVSSGYRSEQSEIGYDVSRGPNEECLIKYCNSGKGWVEAAGKRYGVNPGSIVLCAAQTRHSYGADPSDPWSVYWAYFTGKNSISLMSLLLDREAVKVLQHGIDKRLELYFFHLIEAMSRGYARQNILYASSLLRAAVLYVNTKMEPFSARNNCRLDDVLKFMTENISGSLSLGQMADMMGLSRDYFTKIFFNKFGYTPVDYFIRIKMQRAAELLSVTGMTIKEISENLGYEDYYYFSRLFKKKTGFSPKKYRQKF